ncbi:YciI family protein [Chitinophaga arvensicola]|uniref:Uncharacterized conserved protein n=1 Tax=Chitinophaga arvensicola TaxID=29529 RepID=A0A1I0QDN2_9BACT|nr:YciI family protein [Chitinophaga arvensicola]SEW25067.1 Uncharacterized conserved protein [Chitinophaga arvensicola]
MKEFALLFRQSEYAYDKLSAEEYQHLHKNWQDWIGGIAAQGKFVNKGSRLALEGKVLKAGGVVTDGPFVEIRERLGGFIVVMADSLEEATTLAHGCPALNYSGSVEVRELMQ